MSEIEDLANAIRKLHGVESRHIESVPVKEVFQGQTVWEGIVDVFDLTDHPKAARCYAWRYQDDDGKTHYTAVLRNPPVKTPQDAVKASIMAKVKDGYKKA